VWLPASRRRLIRVPSAALVLYPESMAARGPGPLPLGVEVPIREAHLPIWRELTWWADWLQLRGSAVYAGDGLPRGNGDPVVVVPGFLGTDGYLGEMRDWLARIGYQPHDSQVGWNADCPDVILERLIENVRQIHKTTGRQLRIIGHSLGGTISRAAAVYEPALFVEVITLGSPLREIAVHPLVLGIARLLGELIPAPDESPRPHGDHIHDNTCSAEFAAALQQPLPTGIRFVSIYSRTDGIVDWRSCVDEPPGRNIEVDGTHLGLVYNVETYRAIAEALSAG
jgi:triacylglycerol lipase